MMRMIRCGISSLRFPNCKMRVFEGVGGFGSMASIDTIRFDRRHIGKIKAGGTDFSIALLRKR